MEIYNKNSQPLNNQYNKEYRQHLIHLLPHLKVGGTTIPHQIQL